MHLVHKKDDRRLPKNWRPISLLNTDYIPASKIITERLKNVMSSIVHQDRTCGDLRRSIQFSNLHLFRDTLDIIDKTTEPAILLMLNQEKAFDRVDNKNLVLAHLFVIYSAHAFSRMAGFLALSTSIGVLDRAVLRPLYSMFWSQRSCLHKFVTVKILRA